ncbi:CHAT domain-containing protein [Trichophaea hybrida]|nr:CHAT domain-containing protein [Trichophaea hybrida]
MTGELALAGLSTDSETDRAPVLAHWGNLWELKYFTTDDPDNLDQLDVAIILLQESILFPFRCPQDAPSILSLLAHLLLTRFHRRGDLDDLNQAINHSLQLFSDMWNSTNVPYDFRLGAGRSAAVILWHIGEPEKAFEIHEEAIYGLPAISQRSLGRASQQSALSRRNVNQLAANGGAMALHNGQGVYNAIELLEIGRGSILGLAMDCRSDISDMKARHPDQFNEFERLRREIDTPLVEATAIYNTIGDQTRNLALNRRMLAVSEYQSALAAIRQLPGYEGFLLPPSPEDLMSMAIDGPIIIVNCPDIYVDCNDAIIITCTEIKALLAWLWAVAVEPILDELELDGSDDTNQTHIWWIGVGALSRAPFHAAGYHTPGSLQNTMSRAISSYIPTIKALSYARQKEFTLLDRLADDANKAEMHASASDNQLLLITMQSTQGSQSSALPGVKQEANRILAVLPHGMSAPVLEQPSARDVLQRLRFSSIIHFACHGISDEDDPSQSRLLLHNPDPTSSEPDSLTARDIFDHTSVEWSGAQLAYLSACSTADNSNVELADEVIHIASAFQLAGFSHVLATMWKARDDICSEVAVEFYRVLFGETSKGELGHRKVSWAFHEAVKKVWSKRPDNALGWAPFIHTGA